MTARYIGRLAPSPTGLLHLGHVATFWAAHQRAQQHNGTLLLRNEDLDSQRSRPEFVDAMLEDLAWLGIAWQPPMLSQSTRLAAYRAAFQKLLATGLVYRCTCSRSDLASSLQAPHDDQEAEPIYSGRCRPQEPAPLADFAPGNYRFRVPDGEAIRFTDLNLGPQSFTALAAPSPLMDSPHAFGDFIVWRKPASRRPLVNSPTNSGAPHLDCEMWDGSAGLPSYQLACVVDDAFQQITEVVRGADLLKSTARQVLLQRALGYATPAYFHTRLLRDQHGVRLAKRHDALALRTLREQGLTPTQVLAHLPAQSGRSKVRA
ncbi:MAG TPA: glutamate--tRNA ligase family protein [Acidobacteriaceae bacterium]